jgi:tetratricopeptide (TPR) repeat protein
MVCKGTYCRMGLTLESEHVPNMQNPPDSVVNEPPLLALDTPGDDHLDNFEEFFEHLNRAAKSVLPRVSRRHSGAYVLLLRWEDDDLGTETEVSDLEEVFRDVYHYNTERYLIPSVDPTTQLEYRLNDFRRAYDNGTNLLIIYYGGHGVLDYSKQRPSRSSWQANQNGGATLVWSDLQGVLERAKSDVIFILDCCFAASATRCAGSKEGLWACNSEVTTTGVNDNSFTRNLIAELNSLSTSRFNITMLHAKLMRRYRKPGPHMLLTEPWYTYLGDVVLPSIELIPQPPNQMGSACSATITTEAQNHISNKLSEVAPLTIDHTMTETLVLLAVRLKDTERIPKLLSWQDWCHDLAPDDIESVHALGRLQIRDLVKLEAHFLSNSALILVSMPIFIWDRLPSNPSYSFIGFIKSANLLFPSWNPQQEMFLNSSTNKEDWARVKTIEELSEAGGHYLGWEDQESKANLATAYESQGLWKEAEELFMQVIEARQSFLGAKHPDTLTSMNNLAMIYTNQGRWNKAENLEVQVMEARKRVLGVEHPSTLTSMGNLASIYRNQGRWKEAEELEVQATKTFERVLGVDHLSTLTSMANLASTFWNQGRWKEAEELEVQVMETRKRVLGQEHPSTLTSVANLASTLWNQGRWKEAEELEVQVTETRKRVLGQEHPDTLTSIANLASTYRNQGRWKEAEELEVQVTETRKRVLGQEHPETLTSIANLASTYQNQGRWKEAEELEVQVMETRKRVLGLEHPSTLTGIANLASTFWNQGRWNEADELFVQVTEMRKRILGPEHPDTLTSMASLALTYRNQGRWKEAEELSVQVMETRKRVLGQDHPDTLTSMANLASTYQNQGRWKEAEELSVQVMETRKRVLGQDHPETLTSMANLASTYQNQRRWKEAEELSVQVMETRKRVLGQEHPDTLTSMNNLAFMWKG